MTAPYGRYFDPAESIAAQTEGADFVHVLTTVAQRYVGSNPPHGPVYRLTRASAIRKREDHTYEVPYGRMFPGMQSGQLGYAWAKLWIDEPQEFVFHLRCLGPVRLYHNGEKRFGSCAEEESAEGGPLLKLKLALSRGWNHFVFELGKGADGECGAIFGTSNRKNKPYHFLAPSVEREGEEGWMYTAPLDAPLNRIPAETLPEAATGAGWLPVKHNRVTNAVRMERLYGIQPGMTALAWTKVVAPSATVRKVTVSGTACSPLRFEWNGAGLYWVEQAGAFSFELDMTRGSGDLVVQCTCDVQSWGFEIKELSWGAKLAAPRLVQGHDGSWLCLGPFPAEARIEAADYLSMDRTAQGKHGAFFWTTDLPGEHVRPFLDNELFGRWNYPLGVTLNGLLEASRLLQRSDLADYVAAHVEFATSTYVYSLWDREKFGAAGLNNQLSHIDSLDDCGSFGALAIAAESVRPLKGMREAADDIARYIMHEQSRMEDGALYRKIGVSPSMHNTMWCDDMYMSVPFLCRYAELTGDGRYLDEAAGQLLLYKKYLFMPELQIMSHVYDVAKGMPSRTTWGRGNGWVFFSLAVLLSVLPQRHEHHAAILAFYRELAEGYLRLQGANGLWHQVLTDPESYEESSCTSMFMYGYALGVRHGWLEDREPYVRAALAGWRGLIERAIDKRGNLYGVCKGSSWSYSNAYYKHDLGWNLNDTHGIGIVLLAGIETKRMADALGIGS
ncbi:glycoside hydrolase family 105 protein [Paenibacillus chartarius]|uniref:Glycoside hydrolase family 105 protein n=1 Tax=Paenibacillus chartarius TaxID=747481 RepID=A0ABV6DT17_9BACL